MSYMFEQAGRQKQLKEKIVFIGQHMDVEQIKRDLDFCLDTTAEISGI